MHNNGRFVIARVGSTQIILPFLYPAAKLTAHLGFVRVSELHSSVIVQLSRINPLRFIAELKNQLPLNLQNAVKPGTKRTADDLQYRDTFSNCMKAVKRIKDIVYVAYIYTIL